MFPCEFESHHPHKDIGDGFAGVFFLVKTGMDRFEIIDEERRLVRRTAPPEEEGTVWFAMSAPYCRELKAKALLDEIGMENFVAMHWVKVEGSRRRKLVPAIHNLIFVHANKEKVQQAKASIPFLQYRTMAIEGRNRPIVVPDWQMDQFIKVCDTLNDKLTFFDPEKSQLLKGARVRISGGEFDGVTGTFLRTKGRSSRRVIVEIPLLATVVTATIPADQLEIIQG